MAPLYTGNLRCNGRSPSNAKGNAMKYKNLVLVMSVMLFGYSTVSFLYLSSTGARPSQTANRAVDEQVVQYNAAVKFGSLNDRCVQAGFVASAYSQAMDEPNYQAWSGIRNNECKAAGIGQ